MPPTAPAPDPFQEGLHDVAIVGGGMVGLTLGIALSGAGLRVVLIDKADPAGFTEAAYDGRSSAIARGSQQALAALGIWRELAPAAQPILDIRVSDGRLDRPASRLVLDYAHDEVAERAVPGAPPAPLGYIVENRAIRSALNACVARAERLTVLAPAAVARLALPRDAGPVRFSLDDGTQISARLLIGADGRGSAVRAAAGIRTTEWAYPQSGIVCTVGHERPHNGLAHEHFLPSGPFAMLPMVDGPDGQPRSSLVWTERRALVPAMMALDDAAFGHELERRFGRTLGRLRPLGRRWAYPLSLMHAERYTAPRVALVGDAAHVIHPIAGQGLNLGLRDVAALAETVVDAHRVGLDIGDAGVLAGYQRWRRADNLLLTVVTDGLNRLFSNDIGPLRLARDLGLAVVDRLPPLKRAFMRHAMGLTGDLPRLIKGERL